MAKAKSIDGVFNILAESVKIYCMNFLQFTGYMAFPVLGQVLGIGLILGLANLYSANLPALMERNAAFNDFSTIVLCVILITVPGMVIFLKAFWDFLVAYGALNSMAESALTTGRVYDFPAHNALVTQHTFKYVGLWSVLGILGILASIPLLWVVAAVFFVYFILLFQVYIFEPETSIIDCFKRSFTLIKGNFAKTFLLMCIVAFFTHYLFVEGFSVFFDLTKITQLLSNPFENWVMTTLPLDDVNNWLLNINPRIEIITPAKVAAFLIYQIVFFIVTGFTLPLRSVCWTLWYKSLAGTSVKNEVKPKKKPKRKED